jgi:hypothetical protein
MGDADRREQVQRLFANHAAVAAGHGAGCAAMQQSSREDWRTTNDHREDRETLHALAPDLPINHRMASRVALVQE